MAGARNEINPVGVGDPYNKKVKPERTEGEKNDAELVARVRRRKCVMFEHDHDNREEALRDIKFLHVPGSQWDEHAKEARGDRPCYEFNELRVKALRVINDMRANRPQGKVRAVEDGDVSTAETREGIIRNIWAVSKGDTITDYAADYQVSGGMGAWRVDTEWNDDTSWNQTVRLLPFKNPFVVWADPAATDQLKTDANDWLISERITKKSFEERWPDRTPVSFDEDQEFDDNDDDWYDAEMVRVCEYWWKEPTRKVLAMLSDGATVEIKEQRAGDTNGVTMANGDPLPPGVKIMRRRVVKSHKIRMCIVSGNSVLEPPTDWAGKFFPFVQVFGEWRVIDGKVTWHGLTRFSKDAQRLQNSTMTAIAETVYTAPLSHFWATEKQAKGHVQKWKEAHKKLIPYLPYNPDPEAAGPPTRMGAADVPVALMEMRGISADLMKGTSGIFDASIGRQSNETSGIAITQRTRQGEIATFNYGDNMSAAVCRTWEIIDDLVGKIYTAEQSMRVLGVDGAEKYIVANRVFQKPDGSYGKENDLSKGRYDVTVTSGPSFSTQRQEAAQMYSQMGQALPQVWSVAGDLIFKSFDLPYAEQIAERMRLLLPPPIQKQLQEGAKLPPEVASAMAQAEQAMQAVQQMQGQVNDAMMKAKDEETSAKQATAELKVQQANLKAAEAKLAEDVAKFQAAQAEAALTAATAGMSDEFRQQQQDALASIQERATELFVQYAEQLAQVNAQSVASIAAKPRKRGLKLTRQGDGSFVGEVIDAPEGEEETPPPAGPPPSAPPPSGPPPEAMAA